MDSPNENSWREGFSDAELKEAKQFSTFENLDAFGKSYLSLEKALSSRVEGVAENEDWETMAQKASKFFHIPESNKDYKVDVADNREDVEKLGYKLKLHPMQAKVFAEDYAKILRKKDEAISSQKAERSAEEVKELFKDVQNRDELIAKALNSSGLNLEDFKKSVGAAYNTKALQKLLVAAGKAMGEGKSSVEDKVPAVTTKTGGSEGVDSEEVAQRKYDWIQGMLKSSKKGAFFNPAHPDYVEKRATYKQYLKDLDDFSKRTGTVIRFV